MYVHRRFVARHTSPCPLYASISWCLGTEQLCMRSLVHTSLVRRLVTGASCQIDIQVLICTSPVTRLHTKTVRHSLSPVIAAGSVTRGENTSRQLADRLPARHLQGRTCCVGARQPVASICARGCTSQLLGLSSFVDSLGPAHS
jgi:hypothetical protein